MKNKTKLFLTLLTYGLVIAFILILEFGSNELKNIACPIIAVAGAISSISALVYWFFDAKSKERYLVVFYEQEYCTLTTAWTNEELEERGFKVIDEFKTKDESTLYVLEMKSDKEVDNKKTQE
jgi:hypothetical protein